LGRTDALAACFRNGRFWRACVWQLVELQNEYPFARPCGSAEITIGNLTFPQGLADGVALIVMLRDRESEKLPVGLAA
jgi:hypothetical protein